MDENSGLCGTQHCGCPLEFKFPHCNYNCYKSEEKNILAIGSQGIPQSHTTQQTSHDRFIRKSHESVAPSTEDRSSKELSRSRFYIRFCGRWNLPGWPGIDGILQSDLGLFFFFFHPFCGGELEGLDLSSRVFWGLGPGAWGLGLGMNVPCGAVAGH
jgi:hypothetical protein